jgi:geranylgeranyl diphosphate synthase type II
MPLSARIEGSIDRALSRATRAKPPARLASALHHAVKPGGARIRPTIALSVSLACGDDRPALADAAATAIELIHCASLVHDDLPCFDDAEMRRGKLSVHTAYGEALAVLAGDSLIVQGFDTLAQAAPEDATRALILTSELARYTGMPHGICAGQGWESERVIDLATYHRAKTGALFTAATRMGAVAAGQEAEPWTELGARIGEAFQVADDLLDVLQPEAETGKPTGQDAMHDRPSAVRELGVDGAIRRLEDILSGAIASIPACPGEAMLAAMVRRTAERLTPAHHRASATR